MKSLTIRNKASRNSTNEDIVNYMKGENMNCISCYLISGENLKPVQIQEDMLIELCRNLRNKGVETVQFRDSEVLVEGVYVPARGSNINLMVIPNTED